ncbi:MAG: 2-succinyl-5-enolpyruvyl-6-hydroxy-3-cyclohexene-1-carboxylate synthase, partial [Proteobacteria bacterium]|nr:2-succinyl-5-enolpyruvyl-6-hydroxy-3-cyclohexene-1-carboxylate synthase [Pseudomonadota bacterium]
MKRSISISSGPIVNCFVISSGSRSAPLTSAIARTVGTRAIVHFDERGAAFYAVGYARATGLPAVLVCTSGTAAANYLPAVVEASEDRLPLIVLTADRPPELRDTGANQTIDQVGLYGKYVRWEVDLPCPDVRI